MGEHRNLIPKPSLENPKGFFENVQFRTINDRILKDSSYEVKSWNASMPKLHLNASNRLHLQHLVARYSHLYQDWGWKDPRTCLTLKFWIEELNHLNLSSKVRILYIFRSPVKVAYSMFHRGNADLKTSIKIWALYNRLAMDCIDLKKVSCCYMNFDDLCSNTNKTIKRIFKFLKRDYDETDLQYFIDSKLNHGSSASIKTLTLPKQLQTQVTLIEKELQRRALL